MRQGRRLTTMETMNTPILSARSIVKQFGTTFALAGVDIDIAAGESVAIMGASGSGKTTLLHSLAGIVTPDHGTVTFAGQTGPMRIDELNEHRRSQLRRESFGFVFQQGLLVPELTAVENVALALMLNGVARKDAEQHAAGWLAALGLAGLEQRRIGELSGGQAQRVAIARAQVTGASVVFADEPTGALDSQTSADVMGALLYATTGQGRTLVVVTHDETVAARCSRIVRLRDGRIEGAGVAAGGVTGGAIGGAAVGVPVQMPAPPQMSVPPQMPVPPQVSAPVSAGAHANRGASGFEAERSAGGAVQAAPMQAGRAAQPLTAQPHAAQPPAKTSGIRFLGAGWASDAMTLGGFAQYRRKGAAA